ncbi:DNA polymerase III subunit delta [Pararhizobium mangrovi]|uniref:DNA-directed DNA polymerase n=1 Tax=Pararhizobium mangrovi TaxID=2590452 RepID=A0A506U2K7_9HYPH|nr:DNA polymerase III subunit delta [Pararhizobium mangrovi]TPW27274.1 DNA polymerase III subunit delta [Pararhizobium mangrovi]
MAQIRAHEFTRFFASGKHYRLHLVYGPDQGLVAERAVMLAERSGADLTDPFLVVRLDFDDLRGNAGRLSDEVNSIGLFGGQRLVWLRNVGNDRALCDVVGDIARDTDGETSVLIEAGELKRGAALRKRVEDSPGGLAIPCYPDDRRDLQALIDEELAHEELRITPAARERLSGVLGGDRLASRGELQKLALYCRGTGQVTEENVVASVGDAASPSIDDAVDAVLVGDLKALDHALQRIVASKTAIYTAVLACMRSVQTLEALRAKIDETGASPQSVMAQAGRGIHFRRKPAMEGALASWSGDALSRALEHCQNSVLAMRRYPRLEDDIARQALLAIAQRATRRVP